jgi:hypothetical protein
MCVAIGIVRQKKRGAFGRVDMKQSDWNPWGLTLQGEATRVAPAQAELRPPMVCVKLPKSVLGLFHLFRATKLPLF